MQCKWAAWRNGRNQRSLLHISAHSRWLPDDGADNFDFAARLGEHQGAVAQLGERERGTLEVTGSSPVGSIQNIVAKSEKKHSA